MMETKLNKKSLLYLGIILIIALLVFAGLFFYISKKTQTQNQKMKNPETKITNESIMNSLSIPAENPGKVSESVKAEIQKSLSVPSANKEQKKISESDILKSLNIPVKK